MPMLTYSSRSYDCVFYLSAAKQDLTWLPLFCYARCSSHVAFEYERKGGSRRNNISYSYACVLNSPPLSLLAVWIFEGGGCLSSLFFPSSKPMRDEMMYSYTYCRVQEINLLRYAIIRVPAPSTRKIYHYHIIDDWHSKMQWEEDALRISRLVQLMI